MFAVLIIAASCSSTPSPKAPAHDIADARPIAREVASTLLTLSAYDFALVGSLNAERVRAVDPDRYAAVAQDQAQRISETTSKIVSQTVDSAGPVRDRLVVLADVIGQLRKDALAYADARRVDSFARVVAGVNQGWTLLRDLESKLNDDAALDGMIERGMTMRATFAPSTGALLTMGPFGSAEEAAQKAALLGGSGVPATAAPFVVRASFNDRASADAAAAALLKQHIVAIVIDRTSYTFTRSGPAPDAELWREPERYIDTHGAARRMAISSDGALVATGSDDGFVAIFTNDGVLRSLPVANAGVNQLVFTDDAKFLLGGGQTLVTWPVPSARASVGVGEPMRLRGAALSAVYVPLTNYFVASSGGGADPGVVGGRTVDGYPMTDPFPFDVPASGAILATSDAGELFIASQAQGNAGIVDLRVFKLGRDRVPLGVLRVGGTLRAFAVDRNGAYGAIVTDQGTFRFGVNAPDPTKTITKLGGPARDVEFGADGTLYVLEAARLAAYSADGTQRWTQPLTDGRRIVVGRRPIVLDGTTRLVAFAPRDGTPDLLAPVGQIQDLAVSRDGRWVGVVADARRAVLFKLE